MRRIRDSHVPALFEEQLHRRTVDRARGIAVKYKKFDVDSCVRRTLVLLCLTSITSWSWDLGENDNTHNSYIILSLIHI